MKRYETPKDALLSYVDFNIISGLLVMGFTNGEIRVSLGENPAKFLKIKNHDGHLGLITTAKLSFDKKFLLSTAHDGLLMVHQIDTNMIK